MENEEKKENTQEQVKTPSLVSEALKAKEELARENARLEKNIKELREIQDFNTLGGSTTGRPQEAPKKVISDLEYADAALRGETLE
jgi:hypothetical protein